MRKSTRNWSAILEDLKTSGQSQRAFCSDRGIAISTLTYKLRAAKSQASGGDRPKPRFVQLDALTDATTGVHEERDADLVVELPMGVVLRFKGVHR